MKKYLITIIVLLSMGMSGCGSLHSGGKEGVFVDDFFPPKTVIYLSRLESKKSAIVIGGIETQERADIVYDILLDEPLECSWLKSVTYDSTRYTATAFGALRGHQYGGKYHPPRYPKPGYRWVKPQVRISPISREKARIMAEGCGIDFYE